METQQQRYNSPMEQITEYLASQPEAKRRDLQTLHDTILAMAPGVRLWFLDGRDETGRIVSNPNIGYGVQTKTYADGKTKDFYKVGISANTAGFSVYIMGIEDKKYLAETYGKTLGKATITGYCIKFRSLKDLDAGVLREVLRDGLERT